MFAIKNNGGFLTALGQNDLEDEEEKKKKIM